MFAIEAAETADLPPVMRHASAVGYRRSSAGHFATAERRYCSESEDPRAVAPKREAFYASCAARVTGKVPAYLRPVFAYRNAINCRDRSCLALPAGNFWRHQ